MNKTNLVLHCGARAIDRQTLSLIPCPQATETWHPIPHIRLVQEVERSLAASGMKIVVEAYGVTEGNARMFGLLQIANGQDSVDYAYVIGIRGSIDKSLSRGLAVGSSVFVCDNLAFSSEIVFHRKSTKNIEEDIPRMVDTAIGQLSKRYNDQGKRIDTYKATALSDKDAAWLLAEIAGDVFPWQKFGDIYKEFKNPRHPEFGKENLWALFNSVTENLKPRAESKASGLWTLPARTGRLHKICDDYAGLVIDTTAEVTPVTQTEVVVAEAQPAVVLHDEVITAPIIPGPEAAHSGSVE
jgi:hypothetical protein